MIAWGIDFIPFTHAWLATLLRASWQGAIAVGLVWGLCRLVPRISPSVRCWLWRLVLLKFLLLFVWPATIDLPWLPADGFWGGVKRAETRQPTTGEVRSLPGAVSAGGESDFAADSARSDTAQASGITIGSILWAAWLLGVAIVAVVLFMRAKAARRWRKRCTLVKDADILTVCEDLADKLGVYQPPVLFVSEACESPVVFGALRTSVVLPARLLDRADSKRLQLILRHELAHIRRGDLIWNWVATAVWGLFFFHPLVWVALRELRLNQELACDACAVESRDASPADYGALLVELAEQTKAPSNMLVTVGVVESFEFLKSRLKAMKDSGDRSDWGKSLSISLLSLAVIGLLPWRLVAQAPKAVSAGASGLSTTTGPPLAIVSAGEFTIAVDRVRWAQGKVTWMDSGFPVGANFVTGGRDEQSPESDAHALRTNELPNLVVDLRAGIAGDSPSHLVCTVFGKVRADDDRGSAIGAPYLPAHLKMQLQGVDYPTGNGYAAAHLMVRDRRATRIKSLTGDLLVMEVELWQAAFEGPELSTVSTRLFGDAAVRLNRVESAPDGLTVSADILAVTKEKALEAMLSADSPRNRLRVVIEDSAGNVHECTSLAGGGGGGGAGAGAFVLPGDGGGGEYGQSWSTGGANPLASYSFGFASLPEGVTVRRIVCTVTEPLGPPRRTAFEFADLPLP